MKAYLIACLIVILNETSQPRQISFNYVTKVVIFATATFTSFVFFLPCVVRNHVNVNGSYN